MNSRYLPTGAVPIGVAPTSQSAHQDRVTQVTAQSRAQLSLNSLSWDAITQTGAELVALRAHNYKLQQEIYRLQQDIYNVRQDNARRGQEVTHLTTENQTLREQWHRFDGIIHGNDGDKAPSIPAMFFRLDSWAQRVEEMRQSLETIANQVLGSLSGLTGPPVQQSELPRLPPIGPNRRRSQTLRQTGTGVLDGSTS
jgi:cell division protein FtsL